MAVPDYCLYTGFAELDTFRLSYCQFVFRSNSNEGNGWKSLEAKDIL